MSRAVGPIEGETPVRNLDLWVLLMSTVRYSFHRQTYMTSLSWEMVLLYEKALSTRQLSQIAAEIEQQLKAAEEHHITVGSAHDHGMWRKGLNSIRALIAQRELEDGKAEG